MTTSPTTTAAPRRRDEDHGGEGTAHTLATGTDTTRATRLRGLLDAAPDPHDYEAVRAYVHRLTGEGLAVLLVAPGTKVPTDPRTARQKTDDDRAAKAATRDAGDPHWRKARSKAGVHLATTDAALLDGYVDEYRRRYGDDTAVNLAVAPGASGLVVVDADTPAEVEALRADAERVGHSIGDPTVRTPGVQAEDGQWTHSGGGHWWFTIDHPLDTRRADWKASGGYVAMLRDRYVLIPPSQRPEGVYTAAGPVQPLPDWLRGNITAAPARPRREPGTFTGPMRDDGVAQWAAATEWADILEPHGWSDTGTRDGCGCPVWTAPGEHASPKSATTHGPGCTRSSEWNGPNAPMHVWTTNPGPGLAEWIAAGNPVTLSKLDALAALGHWTGDARGSRHAAMDCEGITGGTVLYGDVAADTDGTGTSVPNGATPAASPPVPDGLNLPDEFWTARPVLTHIRDAARARRYPADATFGALLSLLSATVSPRVRVDTGILDPLPLNLFVGLVGDASAGKSSAMRGARHLLTPLRDRYGPGEGLLDPDHVPDGINYPPGEPLLREASSGSGEGITELFMGTESDEADRRKKVRRQVRTNVLVTVPEGQALIQQASRDNSTTWETLRRGWMGEALGQSGAKSETYRHVPDYSLGLTVGFQYRPLGDILTDAHVQVGTPQRFLLVPAADPAAGRHRPDDPGPLDLTSVPVTPMRLCDELRQRVDDEHLARVRGDTPGDALDGHRPVMLAKVAALLALLDCHTTGEYRTEVTVDDWHLAEMVYRVSRGVFDVARNRVREAQAEVNAARERREVRAEVAKARALDNDKDARIMDRITGHLKRAGGHLQIGGRDGLMQRLPSRDRGDARALIERMADEQRVEVTGPADKQTVRLL